MCLKSPRRASHRRSAHAPTARRALTGLLIASILAGGSTEAAVAVDGSSTGPVEGPTPVGNATDLPALEAFFGIDPASPRAVAWTPFLTALSSNPLMRRIVDEAPAASNASGRTLQSVRGDANTAVVQIVTDGLRRVDDADVLAARPLIAKILGGEMSRCRDVGPDGELRRPRIQVEDELAGLEPVLTRAVLAVNRGAPIVAIDDVAWVAANRRADEAQSPTALEGARECDLAATAIRLRLQGPSTDAPVTVRALLRVLVDSARRPHAYAAGDPPAYPQEGLRASVVGSQVARFTVDATSRLKSVDFVKSDFVPSTIMRPDGTVVASSALFDAEIRAWLATMIAADASRFPAREKDGAFADTTYELPFAWAIDEASRADR